MTASIMQVARSLGSMSGWSLSNLELQKIAYIAEMIHLGRTGLPLTSENWQAWANGPVQADLYHKAKVFGTSPVTDIFQAMPLALLSEQKAVRDAYDIMSKFNPGEMVGITHRRGGAWATYYRPGARGTVIPKSAIQREYSELIIEDE